MCEMKIRFSAKASSNLTNCNSLRNSLKVSNLQVRSTVSPEITTVNSGLRCRLDFKQNRNRDRNRNRSVQKLNGIGIGTLNFFQAVGIGIEIGIWLKNWPESES